MPSSISSSNPQAVLLNSKQPLKYIAALLAALVAGQAVLQLGANWVMRTHGKNELRWTEERAAAGDFKHDGKGVLLLGSSVLLGVDSARLQQKVPDFTIRRMVMVGTFFTDWEYSLRRLYREGVRPDYVVLTPLPFQIYGDSFRGDYLPLHWIDRRDIAGLSQEKHLDLTSTSNLYFASVNAFFALRDDFRSAFLGNLIPGHKVLAAGAPNRLTFKEGEVEKRLGDRLVALKELLAGQGTQLVILRYPAPDMEAALDTMKRVAAAKSIPYFSATDFISKSEFEDAYHLSPLGTEQFTDLLAPALSVELNRLEESRRNSR